MVNGTPHEVAATTLSKALTELGFHDGRFATAVNEAFVPAALRDAQALQPGDRLEILSPMQGG
ncbi:sulfur carrier protein ThiS [Paracoccus onchidii]